MTNVEIRDIVLNNLDLVLQRINALTETIEKQYDKNHKHGIIAWAPEETRGHYDGLCRAKYVILDYMAGRFYGEK